MDPFDPEEEALFAELQLLRQYTPQGVRYDPAHLDREAGTAVLAPRRPPDSIEGPLCAGCCKPRVLRAPLDRLGQIWSLQCACAAEEFCLQGDAGKLVRWMEERVGVVESRRMVTAAGLSWTLSAEDHAYVNPLARIHEVKPDPELERRVFGRSAAEGLAAALRGER